MNPGAHVIEACGKTVGRAGKLAQLIGEVPHAARVQVAKQTLSAHFVAYPVLLDVLSSWEKLKKIRGTGPEDATNWAMACDVIAYCHAQVALGATETPVRDASARLFKDSKCIWQPTPRMEVLGPIVDSNKGTFELPDRRRKAIMATASQ